MSNSSALPNPDLVYNTYTGTYETQLVRIALRLDVFTPLANGPANAATVAQACGCDSTGIRVLLNYLTALKLLEQHGDASYALTPTAATFLVRGERTYAGGLVLDETDPALWERVQRAFQTGQPCNYDSVEGFTQDAWLESYSAWRPDKSREMWQAAGMEPGTRPGLRVLDLACGCAIKSLVLAQADPTVHVTALDRAEVLEVARDLATRLQVLPQVTFVAGDLLTNDLGSSCYDAVLLGQISYYLTRAQNADLFRRIYAALVTGGIFVIDALMTSEPPSEQASLYTALLWALSGGAAHSFDQYRDWLAQVGFRVITQRSERWLSAVK